MSNKISQFQYSNANVQTAADLNTINYLFYQYAKIFFINLALLQLSLLSTLVAPPAAL
jgi:hypothetical protein